MDDGASAVTLAPTLEHPVNLGHVLMLIVVHDLAEVKVGDIPVLEVSDRKNAKLNGELAAISDIQTMLPKESYAHDYYKQRVIDATSSDMVYSDVFAIGWPPQSPIRTIENSITKLYADNLLGHGPDDFPRDVIAPYENDLVCRLSTWSPLRGMTGDMEALALYAGQVCGQVKRVPPAADVVHQMMEEAHSALARLGSLK